MFRVRYINNILIILYCVCSFEDSLGSGQFGNVYKAKWRKPDGGTIDVAVKTLKVDESNKEDKVRFLQEAAIMGQFGHTNVLRLHGVVFSDTTVIQSIVFITSPDTTSDRM